MNHSARFVSHLLLWHWTCLTAVAGGGSPAVGAAERAADAAAQALIDRVLSERSVSRRRLSTELAAVADAECAFREFIVSSLLSGDASLDGAIVRRRATISTEKVNQFLAGLAARDPYRLNARSLKLPSLPTELGADGETGTNDGPFDDHPGWRYCRAPTTILARRAAAEDLRARLWTMLRELPASSKTTLGDVLSQNAEASRAVRDGIDRLSLPGTTLHPSGVCRIRALIPQRQIVTLLQVALDQRRGDKLAVDWSRLTAKLPAHLAVDGFSVAPLARPSPTTHPAEE